MNYVEIIAIAKLPRRFRTCRPSWPSSLSHHVAPAPSGFLSDDMTGRRDPALKSISHSLLSDIYLFGLLRFIRSPFASHSFPLTRPASAFSSPFLSAAQSKKQFTCQAEGRACVSVRRTRECTDETTTTRAADLLSLSGLKSALINADAIFLLLC